MSKTPSPASPTENKEATTNEHNLQESSLLAIGDQELIGVKTKATRVTFFEDRAEVVRTASLTLEKGVHWVSLSGVSPYIDDRSIQARIEESSAQVLSANIYRKVTYESELSTDAIHSLETELKQSKRSKELSRQRFEHAKIRKNHIEKLFSNWSTPLSKVPKNLKSPENQEAWRSSYQTLEQSMQKTIDEIFLAIGEQEKSLEEAQRARLRLVQGRQKHPSLAAQIRVQLEVDAPSTLSLSVTYITPCALWRPEHLARLTPEKDDETKGTLEVSTFATVWQCTGEYWDDIEAIFSTARPAREASPPPLEEDKLRVRKKTDEERKQVHVEAREQTIALTSTAQGSRVVEEMPGVDDGGLPISLRPRANVTIESTGQPFRVEVATISLPAKIERILYPEISPAAHFRATATLQNDKALLAGPIRLARGAGLIGRAKLNFVSPGEPFEIGFGSDDGIRVRRLLDEHKDTVPVLGTQKIKRTVKLFLSNLSDQNKNLTITERVPVSEIEGVEVVLLEDGGFLYDNEDGFAKLSLQIPAKGIKKIQIVYEIRASSKVRLSL